MAELVRWLLGLRQAPEWAQSGSSWSIAFHSLPEGPWAVAYVVLGVVCVIGIYYLYRSEASTVGRGMRWLLMAVRTLVLGCVALMLLELVLVVTKHESVPSRLLVLLDTSASMGLNDPYHDDAAQVQLARRLDLADLDALRRAQRLELAKRALGKVLDKLSEGATCHSMGFRKARSHSNETNCPRCRSKGMRRRWGPRCRRPWPNIAVSRWPACSLPATASRMPAKTPARPPNRPANRACRWCHWPWARPKAPATPRLAAIEADPVVFVRDPTEIGVLVEGHGLAGRTGTVVLEKRQDAAWSEVGREEVVFDEDKTSRRVAFHVEPAAMGEIDFRARVEDVGIELTDADNVATHTMKVVRQQIRVLLIAGTPSFEVQFLRNALLRDTGLEFACWLQTAGAGYEQMGTRPIRRLPANRQELEHYDVVILFDPDMRALGPAWPELLSEFVGSAGGGLVYVAGEMHTRNLFEGVATDGDAAGSTVDNSWLRMLPVAADPGLYRSNVEVALSSLDPWNLELSTEGALDPIFQFDPEPARNREILTSLPGMYWHFPVTRPSPAPRCSRGTVIRGCATRSAGTCCWPCTATGLVARYSWASTAPIAGAICTKSILTASGPG